MSNEKLLVRGTVVLASSTVIVKILSAAYKIPLTRILGPETMGAFTAVFSIFMPFYAFAVAGIVPSISKITAEIQNKGDGALLYLKDKANEVFLSLAGLMSVLILSVGYYYTIDEGNIASFIGLVVLLPNLFFAVSEAIYKGLNHGRMNMISSAKAGVLESVVKLIIGLSSVVIAGFYFKDNLGDIQLVLTLLTISISGFICKIYLQNDFYYTISDKMKTPVDITKRKIISIAMPIAFSALVISGAGFFDNIVGLEILEGISDAEYIHYYSKFDLSKADDIPLWLFGIYNGYTLTVVNLIPTISAAIGQSALPMITKIKLLNNEEKMKSQINRVLKLTGASVIPISVFCYFFSKEIINILFSDLGGATDIAAIFLRFLSPFVVLSAFSFPFNAILHAYEKQKSVFKIILFASIVKASLTVVLSSVPSINIKGFIYSSCIFYTLIFILTFITIKKIGVKFSIIMPILEPLIFSGVSVMISLYIFNEILFTLPLIIRTIFSATVYIFLYGILLLISDFLVETN